MARPVEKTVLYRKILWLGAAGLTVLVFLAALGIYFTVARHPGAVASLPAADGVGALPAANGARTLITSRESLYNNIYLYSEGPYVSMTFGYNRKIYTESTYDTKDDLDLPVPYTRFMTAGLMYAKNLHSILEIGFGGGRTAWYLHRSLPDVPVTSIELDPAVIELSRHYFGIRDEPGFSVVNEDGRMFLSNSKDRYDIILIDAYRGPFVPFHLLTQEFYRIVKDHLSDGGVVVQNVEPTTMLFDSAVMTMRSVFPELDFYVSNGNVVTVAYEGDRRAPGDLKHMADQRQESLHLRYDLRQLLAQRQDFSSGAINTDAKVLTDDFAPVEALKAIEAHNRKWTDQ